MSETKIREMTEIQLMLLVEQILKKGESINEIYLKTQDSKIFIDRYLQELSDDIKVQITANKAQIEQDKKAIQSYRGKLLSNNVSIKDQIEQAKKEIQSYRDQLLNNDDNIKAEIQQAKDDIQSYSQELAGAISTHIEANKAQIEQDKKTIQSYRDSLFSNSGSIKAEIEQAKKEIQSYRDQLLNNDDNIQAEIKQAQDEIQSYYQKLFEVETGIKTEIQAAREHIKEESAAIASIKEQISDLLPNATSAGLAASYESKSTAAGWKKVLPDWIVWGLFVASLIGLCFSFLSVVIWSTNDWVIGIVRATCGLPLVWIAWVCQRVIFQNKRIREEYYHKASVMKTYVGFRAEIEKERGYKHNISETLLTIVLDNISFNPANVVQSQKDFISGENSISNLLKKTAPSESESE